MDKEVDKLLNCKSEFKYPTIDPKRHLRLLKFPSTPKGTLENTTINSKRHDSQPGSTSDIPESEPQYHLESVPFDNLHNIHYKALSYTWGRAQYINDVREIHIDGQPFWIRENLFDFCAIAAERGECGLFFIDAICINQLDYAERKFQVQEMARIYRKADEVIAWLGVPDACQLSNVQALSHARGMSHRDCATWTKSQWEGFRYLSYHPFWTRMWIVQEVLLATSMVVWCGSSKFPLALFEGTTGTMPQNQVKFAQNGRPSTVTNYSLRLLSPATNITTHRLRYVSQLVLDPMAQGTNIGTMQEMTKGLRSPFGVMTTYQSQIPDLLYQAVHRFAHLECTDTRDRLYGLLGILHERSRARIDVDYREDVSYAYYQALKVGLQELYFERGDLVHLRGYGDEDHTYFAYYCDARDAFRIEDGQSLLILRRVLGELDFKTRFHDTIYGLQQQIIWDDTDTKIHPDFKQLISHAEEKKMGLGTKDLVSTINVPRSSWTLSGRGEHQRRQDAAPLHGKRFSKRWQWGLRF